MKKEQRKKVTVQGIGNPVPATQGSEQAGYQSSRSSDRNVTAVVDLVAVADTATRNNISSTTRNVQESPFQASQKIPRSPTRSRSNSIGEINKMNSVLENPPSTEVGQSDSGDDHLLLARDPFMQSAGAPRSPPTGVSNAQTKTPAGNKERGMNNNVTAIQDGFKRIEQENHELKEKLRQLEQTTSMLYNEVKRLTEENEELKNSINHKSKKTNEINSDLTLLKFSTDEEELQRETDWVLKKKKRPAKKRKAESSPECKTDQSPKKGGEKTAKSKEQPPPPINISGLANFSEVKLLMSAVTTKEYKIVSLNNDIWKILTPDADTYRSLAKKLSEDSIQWYTYESKDKRPIKVMARGLHPTCDKQDIIEDLQKKGLKIIDAANIIKKERKENDTGNPVICKRGLPLFMLTFENEEKAENIYDIRSILNMKVKIEPLRKTSDLIPQCKKCQAFNHTQKYCSREPRCVKCAGKHEAQNCQKSKNTPPSCINCKGNHPANYRGCEVAKELQKIRNRKGKSKHLKKNEEQPQQNRPHVGPVCKTHDKTYAAVVKQTDPTKMAESESSHILEEILKSLNTLKIGLEEQKETNKKIFENFKRIDAKSHTAKTKKK